ncbi:MAG: tetratricopeptide repeat protein [Pseudomonadota bacterium]|nr:tetratricopeptide repeat protein [Pseudomonadota bacterium]
MNRKFLPLLALSLWLSACAGFDNSKTLASLRDVRIDITEEKVEGSLDKAMQSYQRFLQETPESALTPEAIRRLADLKLEKEYGVVDSSALLDSSDQPPAEKPVPPISQQKDDNAPVAQEADPTRQKNRESLAEFEKRATRTDELEEPGGTEKVQLPNGQASDLQTVGGMQAIALYQKLLKKYPLYERNDQVLYQLSRAYEETGQIEKAMQVLNRIVEKYPDSRHMDEVQFRRAEYYFTRKQYRSAESAYKSVLVFGVSSGFYELALYKQGWAYFKQERYEQALNNFMKLLDYKVGNGYDFEQTANKTEKKHVEDTFRVISLSFSYLGGAPAVVDYFSRNGSRSYEVNIYSHLGEYYLTKRRFSDAASAYNKFVELNPYHKNAPHFHTRVIEIYKEGGFPKLVVEAKKEFANRYGLESTYWTYFDINKYQKVVDALQTNLIDLANHFHALYQDRRFARDKQENFAEAARWYRAYLKSFPDNEKSPGINYLLAELYMQNKQFDNAAQEYERTAYQYPEHEKSAAAGYAAVYAYRQQLKVVSPARKQQVKRDSIRSSLKFTDSYPKHAKAPVVLARAADDLFEMRDYSLAIKTGEQLLQRYPDGKSNLRYSAQLVVAHSAFELKRFQAAEQAYLKVLNYDTADAKSRGEIVENLAASVYKQGELALLEKDYEAAAGHYLRVGQVAPQAKIRATAEYDAATSLINLEAWSRAARVLEQFRQRYPGHKLRADVTKKLAVVYKEDGQFASAAAEFERIEKNEKDPALRREALYQAAELYEQAEDISSALAIYRRYVKLFPRPLEEVLETRQKIARIYQNRGENEKYVKELQQIVRSDANAGRQRTDRTRYLAARAALVLTESAFTRFKQVKLVKPFKKNLQIKKSRMKEAIAAYTRLVDYGVGEATAAATYHIAEIYYLFSRALKESERPDNLSPLEKEQYELALEEQIFPFEEKAITIHKKNLELLSRGVFNRWIDNSLDKLANLLPARFGKPEQSLAYVSQIRPYTIREGMDSVDSGNSTSTQAMDHSNSGGGNYAAAETGSY